MRYQGKEKDKRLCDHSSVLVIFRFLTLRGWGREVREGCEAVLALNSLERMAIKCIED